MRLRDFPQDINKNFTKIAVLVEDLVSDVAEQIQSPRTKKTLNTALDMLRPHFVSLGVRVSVLGPHSVELILPRKTRNLGADGEILPGVQISAGIEAYKLLWMRNAPEGEFRIQIKNVKVQFFKAGQGPLRLRGELSEIARESKWAELLKNKRSHHVMSLHVYDSEEQICAEIEIESELYLQEMLDWK